MRIKMCSVHVNDPAAAFDFYTSVLGFQELLTMPEHQLYVVKSPEDPDGVGLLLEPSDNRVSQKYAQGIRSLGLPAIVFGSPDVRAEYERLRALGVHFIGEPSTDASGTSVLFDDTCGNLIQLHED
ncbi:glyoxalase [Cryobacterium sp. TMT1-21]|uniref:Glyoxalase n=1 Tax=Cryobacterium shii TaxID=1259235 RepID=A0AAQ2HF85_9MICO|nr:MULTISPECIES: VOC family protein [Cryobacterium]TFC46583.1 glyoxalase [Cryobacterium shii]TFC82658.1 glyoxalase [Cryobacterium sp. TmT2-59]TFD10192.1 glyoxalase [Cryobacterium sp. TMT1-21]TFD14127.1 glyoxalase [Cryobacterium sp. TMT4-10]TFD22723.1 glyoxalase [Cryobacterium sp. TMT2-23]